MNKLTGKEMADNEKEKHFKSEIEPLFGQIYDYIDVIYQNNYHSDIRVDIKELELCKNIIENCFYELKDENKLNLEMKLLLLEISTYSMRILYDKELKKINKETLNETFFEKDNEEKNGDNYFIYIGKRLNSIDEYKIGITNDLSKRINALKTGCYDFEIIASCNTHNKKISQRIENGLHGSFLHNRLGGEWFVLSNDDLNWIIDQFKFNKTI